MSLKGRKSNRAQSSGPPGAAGGEGGGFPGRLTGNGGSPSNSRIQSLVASAPERTTLALILVGMVIGLITAYVIIPTEFTGASPRHMSQQAIQQWVRMVAVGHSEDVHYDDDNALLVLQQIPNPQGVVEGLVRSAQVPAAERAALEALTDISGYSALTGADAPQDPGIAGSALQVILALAAVAVGVPILVIAGRTVYPTRGDAEAMKRGKTA